MKKLEKKLSCPRCGCTDAITPLQKFILFGGVHYATRCRQCGCALGNVWWYNCMVAIGIVIAGFGFFHVMNFLKIHMLISVANESLYKWCIALLFSLVHLCISGFVALYFIPNREGWDDYKKK